MRDMDEEIDEKEERMLILIDTVAPYDVEVKAGARSYSVLVLDMREYRTDEWTELITGFASIEVATEYATRRIRASIEDIRETHSNPVDIRRVWFEFGDDCVVIGGNYRGSAHLSTYIENVAVGEECAYWALEPRWG